MVPSAGRLADLVQLLEEHHLVVLSDDAPDRARVARAVADHLAGLADAQVVTVDGRRVRRVADLVRSLRPADGPAPRQSLEGLVAMLRRVSGPARHRFIVWTEADEMLEHDVTAFSEAVNALLAVAVEHEHFSPDRLMLQRVIFLGGDKLGAYAEEEHGQFRRWLLHGGGAPLRAVSEFVARPPVITYRIDG
jgi:hypothetical protein